MFTNKIDQQKCVSCIRVIRYRSYLGEKIDGRLWILLERILKNKQQQKSKTSIPCRGLQRVGWGWSVQTYLPCLFLTDGYFLHKLHRVQASSMSPELMSQGPLSCSCHYLHMSLSSPKWSPQCSEVVGGLRSFLVRRIQFISHYPKASSASADGRMPLYLWLQH